MEWLLKLLGITTNVAPSKVEQLKSVSIKDPAWITEAKSIMGKHEVKDNSFLKKWLFRDKKTLGDPAKLPWCGDFVETALKLHLANENWPDELRKNPYWARNWAKFGVAAPHMPYGCVVVFERPGGGGHVGFAVGISKDKKNIYVLGGNQSNTVSIAPISASRLIASRWPKSFRMSKVKLPIRSGGTVSTNEA